MNTRYMTSTVAAVSLITCASSLLSGCKYMRCCDFEESGVVSLSGFPLYRAYLTEGDLVRDEPITDFVVERVDVSSVPTFAGLTADEIADLLNPLNPLPRQVVVDARIQEVSTGYMNQIGIDDLGAGFAITTNYADGRSNEQVFVAEGGETAVDWNLDLLLYSFRRGTWSGISMVPIAEEEGEQRELVNGRRPVRFLPPGVTLDPPPPNQVTIMVSPAIVTESGRLRQMGVTADDMSSPARTSIITPGSDAQPRTEISTPPSSPRTEIVTPGGEVGVIGRERGAGRGRNTMWGDYFSVDVNAGFAAVNVPETGFGTHITNLNDEIFLVKSPDFLTGYSLGGGFSIPLREPFPAYTEPEGGRRSLRPLNFFANFTYTDVSGDEFVRIEPGGDVTAVTIPNLMSPGGFTGTGFGMLGAEGTMDVDFEEWDIELGAGFDHYVCGCCCTRLNFSPHFNITGSDLTYNSSVRIAALPSNVAFLRQNIETNTFGLGLRTTVDHRLCRSLSIFASADVGGYYYDADGHSSYMQDFPALAPPDNLFEINENGSTDGIGFRGGLEVGLRWQFNSNMGAKVFGGFVYESDQAFFDNPENPAQPVSRVATDDLLRAYVGAGFQYSF